MMRTRILAWLCAGLALGLAATAHSGTSKHFVDGVWFDGHTFVRAEFYSVDGLLVKKQPAGPVETIDLHRGYVVPAFGDAHLHFPSSRNNLEKSNRLLLGTGVFYVLNPNDIAERSNVIRDQLGTPSTVDVVFSHAGFTCPGGHPTRLYEQLVEQGIYPYTKSELEGRAFYSINSTADIERYWPVFLAGEPQFVKIFLLHSETYEQRSQPHGQSGLRPEYAAEIVRRAHLVPLRAGAHVESAHDFHVALVAGVDFVMHLPGYYWLPGDAASEYLISDTDITLARKNNVTVVTTIDLSDGEPKETLGQERQVQAQNLRRLKDAGVKIVIGTDTDAGAIMSEVEDLGATGVFSNLELLRMLTDDTPRAIFPARRIGRLEEGYEASFLVLGGNPLKFLSALKAVELRVKQGEAWRP